MVSSMHSHHFPSASFPICLSCTLVSLMLCDIWCLVSGVCCCLVSGSQSPYTTRAKQAVTDGAHLRMRSFPEFTIRPYVDVYAPSQFTRPSHIKQTVACDPVSDGISSKTKSDKPDTGMYNYINGPFANFVASIIEICK